MLRNCWLFIMLGMVAAGLALCEAATADRYLPRPLQAGMDRIALPRIRYHNARIREVFRYAIERSPAFDDLVQTLEQQSRIVYVEEGLCPAARTSCLHLMPTPGGRNIRVRIDPRQDLVWVAVRLAHELYHASEIARTPSVVDDEGVRALYKRIGYRNHACSAHECWDTRAAVAFEALVTKS